MKFQVGDIILRFKRKEPRIVLAHHRGDYILSDSKNGFGEVWWNKYQVEKQFKLVSKGMDKTEPECAKK